MRAIAALLVLGLTLPLTAAPLPPSVEKTLKEGIAIGENQEAKVQGVLKDADGVHLFKLLKDQIYSIDLTSAGFKGRLRVDFAEGKMAPIISDNGKAAFKAPADGTYRLAVSPIAGAGGRYVLTMQQRNLPLLAAGVLTVGPGGLSVESSIAENDPPDRARRHRCKIIEVKFQAGKTYTIDLISAWDNYLRLENAQGQQLAEDDDSGGNFNARINFRAPANGVYRVIATSFAGAIGNFNLKIREN